MALIAKPEGPLESDADCPGRNIPALAENVWHRLMVSDVLGSKWGGTDPMCPIGYLRAPTFSFYGWNTEVAKRLATYHIPTLILHGLDDKITPPSNAECTFKALTRVTTPVTDNNVVLVQLEGAAHALLWEGCYGARCDDGDPNTIPYGGKSQMKSQIWFGPYSTVSAALIEWVNNGAFYRNQKGCFKINKSGIVGSVTCPQ